MDSVYSSHIIDNQNMEVSEIKALICDKNIFDRDAIMAKSQSEVAKIVQDQINEENKIDFTNPNTVINILSRCVSNAIVTTTEDAIPVVLSAYLTQVNAKLKTEVKDEVMIETKEFVCESVVKVNRELTEKMVRASYKSDKQELFDRRLNLTLTGVEEDVQEKTNPSLTADKIVAELSDIGCSIKKEDLSSYHRLYRKDMSNTNPNLILTRFVSQQVCDHVMGYRTRFNNHEEGKYMNQDMSHLLRRLFSYLRTRDDILIKKSVSFKDGRIIYLLKRNESGCRWSRASNIFDLEKDFNIDLMNNALLSFLGLEDCIVNINLD